VTVYKGHIMQVNAGWTSLSTGQ